MSDVREVDGPDIDVAVASECAGPEKVPVVQGEVVELESVGNPVTGECNMVGCTSGTVNGMAQSVDSAIGGVDCKPIVEYAGNGGWAYVEQPGGTGELVEGCLAKVSNTVRVVGRAVV